MQTMTAIKVPVATRDRLRAAARSEGLSQAALIDTMLADREDHEFWAGIESVSAEEYQESLREDGIALDEDYAIEDGLIDDAN
jgi:arginase family enzyme